MARLTGAMVAVLVACTTTPSPSSPSKGTEAATPPPPTSPGTPIKIVIGATVVTAELWDNAPGRALVDRLPLTLNFDDLNAVEKTARLDPGLPMTGMPDGDDPAPRDIGWYAPSGDVVLYYGDVEYWPGIARIGHISGDIAAIAEQQGRFTATIELPT